MTADDLIGGNMQLKQNRSRRIDLSEAVSALRECTPTPEEIRSASERVWLYILSHEDSLALTQRGENAP